MQHARSGGASLYTVFTHRYRLLIGVATLICVIVLSSTYGGLNLTEGRVRLDRRGRPCTGPQLTPAQRPEPWISFAQVLANEVARADKYTGVELVLYGDSITETWRGTDGGAPSERCNGVPEIFKKHFGRYSSAILAIGGDQAAHLTWRLQHGEVFVKHKPRLVFVMIGTNDLGASWCLGQEKAILDAAPGTADRVIQALEHIRAHNPVSEVVVMAVLPRGSDWTSFSLPSDYSRGIETLNGLLEEFTSKSEKLHFADCSSGFLSQDGQLRPELMPDALHPNPDGMEILATCMQPFVDKYLAKP